MSQPNIYKLSIKQFKDLLVNNMYFTYQQKLEKSISYPFYGKRYHNLSLDDKKYYIDNLIINCQDYCCHSAMLQYHKITNLMHYVHNDIFSYQRVEVIDYEAFLNATYKSMNKIKIKELIWVNTRYADLLNKIKITGDYFTESNRLSIKPGELSYIPNIAYGLKLNDIPVNYISWCAGGNNIQRKKYQHCLKIEFTFDLTTYCKMIDCVLKFRTYRYNFFGRLPFEIIKYILYLTSI